MMNEIKNEILKPYFIKKEIYCISIYEEVIPVIGKPYIKYISHQHTIKDCLLKIIQYKLNIPLQYNTIKEYLETYKNYQEKIKTIKYD